MLRARTIELDWKRRFDSPDFPVSPVRRPGFDILQTSDTIGGLVAA
jgi:hypothetical protein